MAPTEPWKVSGGEELSARSYAVPNGTRLASARRSTATAPAGRTVRTGQQAQRYRQRHDLSVRGHGLDARRLAAVRQAPAAHGGAEAGGVTRAEGLRDDQQAVPDRLFSADAEQQLSRAVP